MTTVPPPRPRRVSTIPACRSAAIASRSVARETPRRSASSRSGGRVLPSGQAPSRMPVASCSTQASKAWCPRTGRSTASPKLTEMRDPASSGDAAAPVDGLTAVSLAPAPRLSMV